MITLEMADATASLAHYARSMNDEPVVVTVNGRPVAALMALDNADMKTIALSTDPQFLALIERARSRAKQEGNIPAQEMRQRLGLV